MSKLKDAFYPNKLDDHQIKKCELLRKAYFNLAHMVDTIVPKCREASLAITKLEESSMWAIKAVSHTSDKDVCLDNAVEATDLPGQVSVYDVVGSDISDVRGLNDLKLGYDEEIPEGMPIGEPYNDI